MTNRVILLWLESPLQSWGYDSKFGRRYTLDFPTKSGILGLLLCAMGKSGTQEELLSQFFCLKQQIISYKLQNTNTENFLMDFHMIGAGYNKSNEWQSKCLLKTSDRKNPVGMGTRITYRYYIQNAKFAIALEVPQLIEKEMVESLINPMYDIYLGRKNCVPTDFIYKGIFDNIDSALVEADKIAIEKGCRENFKVLDSNEPDLGEVIVLNDIPLRFGKEKKYKDRFVTIINNNDDN